METVGYAWIKRDANCNFSMGDPKIWQDKIVRVMEFNAESDSLLVINRSKDAMMGMFEGKDVQSSFQCSDVSGILVPYSKDEIAKFMEVNKRMFRKGGYTRILKEMVIMASLHKKRFEDDFLFAKQ